MDKFDWGEHYFKEKNAQGGAHYCYSTLERAMKEIGCGPEQVEEIDTLKTRKEFERAIHSLPGYSECMEEYGNCSWYDYQGTTISRNSKLPENYSRLMVYAVWGGSEGIYLHIDYRDIETGIVQPLFLAKTLGHGPIKMAEVYKLCGEIAIFLDAR